MDVGKIIKEKRSEKNMTQEDLANEFFVSRQLISKWENGKSYPDLEQLLKLSDFFDLTLDELMRGDKKMTARLNFNLKKKNIMLGIIVILLVIIASIGYFYWSQQMIQLTPEDIEIVSIEKNKVSTKNIYNSEIHEKQTLPEDVSYKIKFKSKKKFIRIHTAHVFETVDSKDPIIYVNILAFNSLFKLHDSDTLYIPASSSPLYDGEKIDDIRLYEFNNKDKSIYLLNIEKFDSNKPQREASWKLIDKTELNNSN